MALSKQAAKAITNDLDKLAQLFEADHAALGVPTNVAKDFAYRCDLLSDFVEKHAAELDRTDSIQKEFDNEVDVAHQPDEPYMADKTTQDELYELGQMTSAGGLGKAALENIAAKVAELLKNASEEEAEEDEEEAEEDEADKKATMIALANDLLRLAGDDEDEGDDDADDEGDDDADEDDADEDEDEGKTAYAHGYSL
tara:strand:- start:713 stop:1306 length:594 start_codon:yes stop_codon:yes gene_type:complete